MSELDFWFWVPAQCLDQQGGGRDTVGGIQCLTPEGYDTHQLRHLGQLSASGSFVYEVSSSWGS